MQIYYNTNFANIILLILLLIILSDHTFDGTKLFLTHDIAILSKRLKPGNIKSQLSKILLDQYLRSSFKLCWVQIFLWVKLYMRQTCILFNWFWQFLFEELSSFNSKAFCYSCTWSFSLCEGGSFLLQTYFWKNLEVPMFLTGFTSFIVILLFLLSITFFIFMYDFWC